MGCDCCRDSDGRPLLRTDGPRAGINCPPPPADLDPTFFSLTDLTGTHCRAGNDGFAGGSTVEGNLVFNMVRETGDHGPYNSWDRQPYLTHSGHRDGYPDSVKHGTSGASILKQHDLITKNVFINGYNGVWTIDHDDGSQYFNDTQNFMVFGEDSNGLPPPRWRLTRTVAAIRRLQELPGQPQVLRPQRHRSPRDPLALRGRPALPDGRQQDLR